MAEQIPNCDILVRACSVTCHVSEITDGLVIISTGADGYEIDVALRYARRAIAIRIYPNTVAGRRDALTTTAPKLMTLA